MTELETTFKALVTHVEEVGKIAKDYFDSGDISNEIKTDGSVVTRIDNEIETVLREYIAKNFPDDAIIGEEHADMEGTSGFVWHIDPIDGTDNFVRKIPFFAISVARLGETAEDSFGIVHNPVSGHTFTALMENCTYENDRITNLTELPIGEKLVIGMGRGRKEPWMVPASYRIQEAVGTKYGRCQPFNCTALELAYLSADRIDAFLTFGLSTYDYAAGFFLARAAGAKISVFEHNVWREHTGSIKSLCDTHGKIIFVSHPKIHDEIRDFIGNPMSWNLEKS
jgi:myo-inositol-1(or 4)-monophosphatase